jgi:hypothetical protein
MSKKIERKPGGLRKIKGGYEKEHCISPEHNPPSHMVYEPGTYEYTCPACGKTIVFTVPSMMMAVMEPLPAGKRSLNLDQLQEESDKMSNLLKDRQTGMVSWHQFMHERVNNMYSLVAQGLETAPVKSEN